MCILTTYTHTNNSHTYIYILHVFGVGFWPCCVSQELFDTRCVCTHINSNTLPPIILILRTFELLKDWKQASIRLSEREDITETTIVTNMSTHFLNLDTNMYKSNSTQTTVCIQGYPALPLIYSTDFCNMFIFRQLQTPDLTVCGLVQCFSINQ